MSVLQLAYSHPQWNISFSAKRKKGVTSWQPRLQNKHDGHLRPPGSWFPTQLFLVLLWTPIPTACYCHVRFLCILLINCHEVRGIYLSYFFFLTLKLNSPLNKTTAMTEKERGNEEKRSFYLWMACKGPSCLTLSYYTL